MLTNLTLSEIYIPRTTPRCGSMETDNSYKVPDHPNIAFTVSRGRVYNSSANDLDGGLSLYSSNEGGTVQEYILSDEDGSWSEGYTFPNTNGLGSASTWSQSTDAYLFTVNNDRAMEMWWRRYDDITETRRVDKSTWTLGTSSTGKISSSGSMCGQYDFAFQAADGKIQGSNFTALSDLALQPWALTYDISDNDAINGSGLSCWYFFPSKANTRFHVFYQVEGNQIREARRYGGADNATVPGHWTYQTVPIN